MGDELCQICKSVKFKYTCPKCNILYCSVKCYRAQSHLSCSEQFYKQCIKEELVNEASTSKKSDDVHKMLEILQRVSNEDFIDENTFLNEEQIDELDSDDEEEEEDLTKRLEGINLNDADKLWNILTKDEKFKFESLLQNGEIINFIQDFDPWWIKQIPKKIIKDIDYNEVEDLKKLDYPEIKEYIKDFNEITKTDPHPSVKYSLYNIFGAYSCTVRFFTGDHLLSPLEATNYIWMISSVFNKNAVFNNNEEALKSIIINGQNENLETDMNDYSIIYNDVEKIFNGPFENDSSDVYKLSALSDIQTIFFKAKHEKRKEKTKEDTNTFSVKFANFKIKEELTKDKIAQLIKRVDFFLSYVKSKIYLQNNI